VVVAPIILREVKLVVVADIIHYYNEMKGCMKHVCS
jgi:hypothetical protein